MGSIRLPLLLLVLSGSGPARAAPPPARVAAAAVDVDVSLFLIGDAGEPSPRGEPVLRALGSEIARDPPRAVVVFLGDNLYPKGLPVPEAADRPEMERRLDAQVDVVKAAGVRGVVVPGNHDWDEGGPDGWEAIRRQVLPAGAPGLLTAVILAASRAMGETAPLIVIGATFFQSFLPYGPDSLFVALPVQIYGYIGLPRQDFLDLPPRNGILDPGEPLLPNGGWPGVAAAGIVILLVILFAFNVLAIIARNRMQRRRW